ncbi:Y-family DNA polymerase [Glaciecola petra]|uniref:DNA polymerase Y family protein n=1 Tax=Glaciecola petra TaxID=3075602 RepID=A0ABU2ZUU1_9ALTE|nr:DNA polymerase Y family protein [Aestuariibacter sp. P117]MDT0596412.1 DNA polymerase Y family protein [Aestuariibacter sp. P117]
MQFDTRSLWVYVYFPQLQLDLLESTRSEQNKAEVPAAIVDIKQNALCQVNQTAHKQGLKQGMGLAAASLLCSDLRLHEYQPEIEANEIQNVANQLYLFTSDIVLAPPNALLLRAQNMLSLYGGLNAYWQIIKHSLNKQNVHFSAASAYSIQAAKMLALSHCNMISASRKKIAAHLAKCPLVHSDIDVKDLAKLARIGVSTFADLNALPNAEIANRVSRVSMSVINELQGKQASKVTFYQPQTVYHDYLELLYEIHLSTKLIPVIARCLKKLSQFLLLRNALCLEIEIGFFQREHDKFTEIFNSIRPIYKIQDWLDIIELKLESIKFESPVYAISIACDKYENAETANQDMFAQKSTHVAALTLLARLQSKLGKTNINTLSFVQDFRPEHSTQKRVFDGSEQCQNTASIFADRPGLLLPEPQALHAEVDVIKGPERIQTGWWDDYPISRDYYIGQSSNGQQLWIFKTPNKEWFLHGYFI